MVDIKDKTKTDRMLTKLKDHRILAFVIVGFLLLYGLGQATDAIDKIRKLLGASDTKQVVVNPVVVVPREVAPQISNAAATSDSALVATDYFPLKTGNWWTYEGQIFATTGDNRLRALDAKLTTRVLDTISSPAKKLTLCVMEGDISGLSWATSEQDVRKAAKTKYGLLVAGNRIYEIGDKDLAHFSWVVRRADWISSEDTPRLSLVFEFPLRAGQMFGGDLPPREDGFYSWTIASYATGTAPDTFRVSYLTNPDDTHFLFTPYVGVVGFDYGNHGTVAETHVHLTDYRVHTKPVPSADARASAAATLPLALASD